MKCGVFTLLLISTYLSWGQSSFICLTSSMEGCRNCYSQQLLQEEKLNKKHEEKDTIAYKVFLLFHIVYNSEIENIPDSFVHKQIELLNRCFNEELDLPRQTYSSYRKKAKIEFLLLPSKPEEGIIHGVKRTKTHRESFGANNLTSINDIKKHDRGGSESYLNQKVINIWIGNINTGNEYRLGGYSSVPWIIANGKKFLTEPNKFDGIVLDYRLIGHDGEHRLSGLTNPLGKALVHEMGHFLGLEHLYGDESDSTPCSSGDHVNDTPASLTPSFSCDLSKNSCFSKDSLPDMVENFMEHSGFRCMTMFTADQVSAMRECLKSRRYQFIPAYHQLDQTGGIEVFPIPCKNYLNVNISPKKIKHPLHISIYNSVGYKVIDQLLIENITSYRINTSSLRPGTYFIKVNNQSGFSFIKFIVI